MWLIVDRWLWADLKKHHGDEPGFVHSERVFTWLVGIVERTLYTTALIVGAWQLIGIWLAMKAAVRWREGAKEHGIGSDNVWLVGSGISLLFAFLAAWIAAGRLPRLN